MSVVPSSSGDQYTHTLDVRSCCWSCGTAITRSVQRRHRHHRHLMWFCAHCETSWAGPAEQA
ncbi:hypothetical protein [Geodermatophilus sp. URMC 62]|uniref:hypothetical protein n=1 Tax=Geodermatophilus sp. URMC 62 TaxID=3423414 RepID=UPI00406CCE28